MKPVSHRDLDDAQQADFADVLDKFSKKVWRKGCSRKAARFDLAMLINLEEKLPPSNRGALKKFINFARIAYPAQKHGCSTKAMPCTLIDWK